MILSRADEGGWLIHQSLSLTENVWGCGKECGDLLLQHFHRTVVNVLQIVDYVCGVRNPSCLLVLWLSSGCGDIPVGDSRWGGRNSRGHEPFLVTSQPRATRVKPEGRREAASGRPMPTISKSSLTHLHIILWHWLLVASVNSFCAVGQGRIAGLTLSSLLLACSGTFLTYRFWWNKKPGTRGPHGKVTGVAFGQS